MGRYWVSILFLCAAAVADEFHYNDILVGERALGLGGAFVALSDDPSGTYYNPAGLVYAPDKYVSASTKALSWGRELYRDIAPSSNYVYKLGTFFPSYFAFTQRLWGGTLGVTITVPNNESVDQADEIQIPSTDSTTAKTINRRLLKQDTTYYYGPAIAYQWDDRTSIGVSTLATTRLAEVFDSVVLLDGGTPDSKYYLENDFLRITEVGYVLKAGILHKLPPSGDSEWAFGLTVAKPVSLSGSASLTRLFTKRDSNGNPPNPSGKFADEMSSTTLDQNYTFPTPLTACAGAVYKSAPYVFSSQLDYHDGGSASGTIPVYNWALGAEYLLSDGLALRLGAYSNNANSPPLAEGGTNQSPHVDQLGLAGGFTVYGGKSTVTGALTYLAGTGSGQAIRDTAAVQTVVRDVLLIFLSGSYQL